MAEASAILVTGARGYLGSRLVEALANESPGPVVALDVKPLPSPDAHGNVTHVVRDIAEPPGELLSSHQVGSVVHLAYALRPGRDRRSAERVNVTGTRNLLEACARQSVRHVIYLSSSTIYGARRDAPVPLSEDAPLHPPYAFQYAWDKTHAEALLATFARENPRTVVTVLRGCVVMGPHASNFITQALSKPLLLGIAGADPPIQFLHHDDLTSLLCHLLQQPVAGTFNVAGEGAVTWSQVAGSLGKRLLWLPAWAAYGLVGLTWRLRLQSDSTAAGLDYIRYPWVVSTERLRAAVGFAPRYSSEQALQSYVVSVSTL